MPRIEDFQSFAFIVGAPRCGTTTMARMLRSHPEIAVPFVKEPHFFSQHDLRGLSDEELRKRVEDDYLAHFFSDPKPGQIVGLDGSVSYLYTPEQLEPILRVWPDSRFIIAVRDPLTLLPSLHKRLLINGDENLRHFEDAWAAVPDRAEGRKIPRSCIEPRWLRYDEAGRFGTYVERLFAAVGRERCMVAVFDDLQADPAGQYRRVLDFLGLDPVEDIPVRTAREGKRLRYPWLQRLLKRPPKFLHPYLANIEFRKRFNRHAEDPSGKNGVAARVLSLRRRLLDWNEVEDRKEAISLDVQREIKGAFEGEIERLGRLIDRDFSHWLQPRAEFRA